ncbi:MAG: hypothetical protein ACRDBG_07860 [Waterburya sp.]
MAIVNVYSNNLDASNLNNNLSSRFSKATGFFIAAPLLAQQGIELSIDVFLQTFIRVGNTEFNRLTRIAKVEEQTIFVNLIDTDGLVVIPSEFVEVAEIEYALLFSPTDNTYLEAYAILPDTTLLEIQEKLEEVTAKLDSLVLTEALGDAAIVGNQIAQNTALIAISGVIGAGLAAPTGGASLALPATVSTALLPASTTLLLLGGS